MWDAITAIGGLLLAFALPYFVFNIVVGALAMLRGAGSLRAQEQGLPSRGYSLSNPAMTGYFLMPCLNEALVVGDTVADLLSRSGDGLVAVIDDGSDDGTAETARLAAAAAGGSDRLLVIRRSLPNARLGKGAALNDALAQVRQDVYRRGLDPARVFICVMDADGRLSDEAIPEALAPFEDDRVGAVQLIVRIRNRDRWLTRMQDIEFWCISATAQFARTFTGTVSLGGNGQFTRLSALDTLDGNPWSDSLTEDLDLGLRLYARGWKVTCPAFGYVHQQGVTNLRTLLRQRTRWYQGHMSAITRVPELVRSRHLSEIGLVEVVLYLLVPWMIVLPWSVVQQLVLVAPLIEPQRWFAGALQSDTLKTAAVWAIWYCLSFLPNLLIGITYARRTRAVSLPVSILLGHAMLVYNYVGYAAVWRALFRMCIGRVSWAKTPRSSEARAAAVSVPDGRGGL